MTRFPTIKTICLLALAGLVLAGSPGAWAQDDPATVGGGQTTAEQVKIISSADEAPKFGQYVVKAIFKKKLPEGAEKLRITVGRFFDQGQSNSSNDFEPYVKVLVPVDAKERAHGEEWFLEPRARGPYRTVEWKHGVKEGMERVYNDRPRFVREEVPWKNDQVHGTRKVFDQEGNVLSESTYKRGKIVGSTKSYDSRGRLLREQPYKDGVKHGKRIDYWPQTGKPKRIVPYVEGQAHGEVIEYHLNEKVKRRVPTAEGQLHGKEEVFSDEGELLEVRYWLDGSLVSRAEFEAAQKKG